jgi:hypothetical protein
MHIPKLNDNARFWVVYKGGLIKLTLKPGEVVTLYHYQRTEEGYSAETFSYRFNNGVLTLNYSDEGRDCDGYISRGISRTCEFDELQYRWCDQDQVAFPNWIDQDTEVYDESAVRAGY